MNLFDLLMSQLFSFLVLGMAAAAVMKLFQISTDMGEIKDLLKDIKRNSSDIGPSRRESPLASPAHLMRAVNAEGMDEAELYAQNLLKPPVE